MKSTSFFVASLATLAGFAMMGLDGQTPVTPASNPMTVDLPIGRRCIVSFDPHVSRSGLPATANQASGFEADGTAEGQLIRLSGEWCVLKDDKVEKWIPAAKILMIRASD